MKTKSIKIKKSSPKFVPGYYLIQIFDTQANGPYHCETEEQLKKYLLDASPAEDSEGFTVFLVTEAIKVQFKTSFKLAPVTSLHMSLLGDGV